MDCEESASPEPVDLLRDEVEAGYTGLATLTLQIEAFEHKDGSHHFCLAALAGGRRVGIAVELRCSSHPPLELSDHALSLPRCEVRLKSTGEESDRFVVAVAAVYDLDLPHGHMPEQLEFQGLCLAGDPARPQLGPLQLMLLYTGSSPARREVREGERFEWFLRIDVTAGEAGFVDKAPDAHRPIVTALSSAPPWRH
jgi:hypothetical protein